MSDTNLILETAIAERVAKLGGRNLVAKVWKGVPEPFPYPGKPFRYCTRTGVATPQGKTSADALRAFGDAANRPLILQAVVEHLDDELRVRERQDQERAERRAKYVAWSQTPEGMATIKEREERQARERSEAAQRAADTRRRRQNELYAKFAAYELSGFAPPEGKKAGGCAVCGKGLIDPASQARGIGPECADNIKEWVANCLKLMEDEIPEGFKITPETPLIVPKTSAGHYPLILVEATRDGWMATPSAAKSVAFDRYDPRVVTISEGGVSFYFRHHAPIAVFRGGPGIEPGMSIDEAVAAVGEGRLLLRLD